MATKSKSADLKKSQTKRVVTEIAPGVRAMLDAYVDSHNDGQDRVAPPLKYTDVINQALDEFLPSRSMPGEEGTTADEKKRAKRKKEKPEKATEKS